MIKKGPVLIEALGLANDSGLGRVSRMLLDALQQVGSGRETVLITRPSYPSPRVENWKHITVRARPFRLWYRLRFPLLIRKLQPEVVICLGQTLPALRPASKYYLLVCDVGPLENLAVQASKHENQNRRLLPKMIRRSHCVLTISQFSKKRIEATTGIPSERIRSFRPISRAYLEPEIDYGNLDEYIGSIISRPFILSLGNIEPRKNHTGLIRAFRRFQESTPESPMLVIAGHKAWGWPEVRDLTQRLGLEDKIHFTGHLPENAIRALLKHCTLFVSPSLYEGWGFPLFEALYYHRPAIYHRNSSQGEFAAGFAKGIDCADEEAISEAITMLYRFEDERRQMTQNLQKGFHRLLQYDLPARLREILGWPAD